MISGLGHCEDPQCSQSSNPELVRLFRCAIHCDRLLCLFHLNSHNVYYEEEKKQNGVVLTEIENSLTLYQSIFEHRIVAYRELVHQASTIILKNKTTMLPIEQLRPVLEKLQKAIAVFQQEKSSNYSFEIFFNIILYLVIIKSEPILDQTDISIEKIDSDLVKDFSSIKKELSTCLKLSENK